MSHYDLLYKIILVGESGVGKSCIMTRFTKDLFSLDTKTTIGVEFYDKTITINNKITKLQIWDTAGQERYRAITNAYYRKTNGIVMVYDITKKQTFQNCERWLKEILDFNTDPIPILLVGNKSDLGHLRTVSIEEATQFAQKSNAGFIETSALNGENISKAFNILSNVIFEQNSKEFFKPTENISVPNPTILVSEPKTTKKCC